MRQVWQFALEDLAVAAKVLVVGYSFPPLDAFATTHLYEPLRVSGKVVRYVLRSGPDANRVQKLLALDDATMALCSWNMSHFDDLLL